MVSKASEDFPDPDRPVMTVRAFLGIVTSMFFRLCILAPLIVILSIVVEMRKESFSTKLAPLRARAEP
jgi:hypothetical protein